MLVSSASGGFKLLSRRLPFSSFRISDFPGFSQERQVRDSKKDHPMNDAFSNSS